MTKLLAKDLNNESLFDDFLSLMPSGWQEDAIALEVMKGAKRDKNIVNALRTILIHLGIGTSLKETAARAKIAGLCNLSSVALYKRLIKFGPLFQLLCNKMLRQNVSVASGEELHFSIVDASDIHEPGPTGSHYRLHYGFSLPDFCCNFMELTSCKGKGTGESLTRFPVTEGEHFIADRGYSHAKGVSYIHKHKGKVLVRLNHSAMRLFFEDGSNFNLIPKLRDLKEPGDSASWSCCIKDPDTLELIQGRICVVRKDDEHIGKSHARAREDSRRKGKNIQDTTLFVNEYIILFTTFEDEKFPLKTILEIYRWRWQVELVFKRFKSLLALGCLPKTTEKSSRAWLYGKMFLALMIEQISYQQYFFSPWRELKKEENELRRQLVEAF